MANFLQNISDAIRGTARSQPQQQPPVTSKEEGLGAGIKAFFNSIVDQIRPLATSAGEAVWWKTGGEKQNTEQTRQLFESADRLNKKSLELIHTNPTESKRLYDLSQQTYEMAGKNTWVPTYSNKEIIGSAAKTAGLTLGLPHLGLGGVAIPGVIGGTIEKAQGGSFSEGFGRGVAETAPYLGLANQVTTPAISRFLPEAVTSSRIFNTGLNVAEGAGLSTLMNQGYSLENIVMDAVLGGTLRPFTKTYFHPETRKLLSTPEAQNVLKEWLNETQAQTKFRRQQGLSPQEMYAASTKKVVNESTFDNIFAKWIGKRDVAKTTGTQESLQFKALPENSGPDIIGWMEGTKADVSQEIKNASTGLKQRFDALRNDAVKAGLDIGYLKNYIFHVWKQSSEEVQAAYKGAGTKYGKRTVPTYEEGVKLGLEPKYTNPGQILGEYARKLEELKANLELVKTLKEQGLIVPAAKAEPGMFPLTGPGFPKSKARTANGETVIGAYYAQPKIAKTINQVFSPQEVNPIIKTAAKISGGIQDVGLAGGVPYTPLNAWTFAQVFWKELPAGRVRGPLKALWASMTGADKYFEDNINVIKMMQKNNIPVNTTLDIESTGRTWLQNSLGTNLPEAWQKAVNEPTFRKFMPAMEIEFFKDAYNVGIRNKLSSVIAEEIAAKATKNFYGIITSDALAKEDALGQNLKQIFLFAPRYRQTILGFLANTVKSFKDPLAPENRANIKWLMGAVISYGIFDLVNLQTTGHHLFENPPGLEDKLLIPAGGGQTIAVPWMSSILTLPRAGYRATMDLSRGDIGGAVGDVASTGLSMGIKPIVDVARNKDYFGREITPANAPVEQKLKDYATYIALQTMHPYLKEVLDPRYQKDPLYQRLSRAAELPLQFYDTKSLNSRWYYAIQDEVKRSLTTDQQQLYDQVYNNPKPKTTVEQKQQSQLEARILLAHPEIIEARKKVVIQSSQKEGQPIDPFFLLTPQQQKVVLQRQALNPGDSDNGLTSQNIDWLKKYWDDRATYFDKLNLPEQQPLEGPQLKTTKEMQDLLDQYYKLPYGTGQRTVFIKQNPELKQYFDEKQQYTNDLREKMGLAPISNNSNFWGTYQKKISVPKLKIPKVKKVKSIKFRKVNFKPLVARKTKLLKTKI